MNLPPLTRRQREILDFFQRYTEQHRISPTLEEIAQYFGINRVTIFGHVEELRRKGVLRRAERNISRGLQIVKGPAPSAESGLPILGTIAAGAPIEALENPQVLPFHEIVPSGKDIYVLRVRGTSMIDDAICDGDMVVVERRTSPLPGETVVAIIPGELATLKRFYPEADGRIRLQPANDQMSPTFHSAIEIRGVVIGLIRRLRVGG
jgi:repressor LexA